MISDDSDRYGSYKKTEDIKSSVFVIIVRSLLEDSLSEDCEVNSPVAPDVSSL